MLRAWQNQIDTLEVRRTLAGDAAAFGRLIDRHWSAAFAVARGIVQVSAEAEDVVQEAFIKAYQKLDSLEQPQRFSGWLLTIVRNTALNVRERYHRERPLDPALAAQPAAAAHPMDREIQDLVALCVDRLDPDQREVLLLRYFAGKSVAQTADVLGISRAAAAKRLQRAREALGKDLLRRVGREAREAFELDARKKRAILSAIAITGAAWQGRAAAAGTTASAGLGIAPLAALKGIAALAIVAAGTTAYLVSDPAREETPVVTMQAQAPETDDPAAPDPREPPAHDTDAQALPTGPGSVLARIRDTEGAPVQAQVLLERVTWEATELPPEKTQTWQAATDAQGDVQFAELPIGRYSIRVTAEGKTGANDVQITAQFPDRRTNVTLYPTPAAFSGTIVNQDDQPVANAVIYPIGHDLFPGEELEHETVAALRQHTDDQGAFSFPYAIPGNMRFFIVAENYAPMRTAFVDVAQPARFTVSPGTRLNAQLVLQESGEPLPGIDLVFHAGRRIAIEARSAEDGYFQIALAPDEYDLTIGDPALTLNQPRLQIPQKPETDHIIEAVRGAVLMGRVFDRDTGAGVAGVKLYVTNARRPIDAVSAADGSYIVTGLPSEHVTISVAEMPDGYVFDHDESKRLTVAAGTITENVDIPLERGRMIKGTVRDRTGDLADGASVTFLSQSPFNSEGRQMDAEKGRFSFTCPLDAELTVSAWDRGAWRSEQLIFTPGDGIPEQIELTLSVQADAVVHGRVRAEGGAPGQYSVQLETGDGSWSTGTQPESSGEFRIEHVPAGNYLLKLFAKRGDHFNYKCPETHTVEVAAGAAVDVGEIACSAPGGMKIAGRVLRPNGRPKAGATVAAMHSAFQALTDARGFFELAGLHPGERYAIQATAQGFAPVTLPEVLPGTLDLVLTLQDLLTLTGTVTDARSGAPVANAAIQYVVMTMENQRESGATTNGEGAFELRNVEPHNGMIMVRAQGYVAHSQQFPQDIGEEELHIELTPEAQARGIVLTEAGVPVPGANLKTVDQQIGASTVTDADGRFVLAGLPNGEATPVRVHHDEYGAALVKITPGESEERIVLAGGTALEIVATTEGQPLRHFQLSMTIGYDGLETRYHEHLSVRTENGMHTIRSLPPCEAEISVSAYDGTRFSGQSDTQFVILRAGETRRLEFSFDIGSSVLTGQITCNGKPLTTGDITAFRPNFQYAHRGTSPDPATGEYRLEDLQPGEYLLRVNGHLASAATARSRLIPFKVERDAEQRLDIELCDDDPAQLTLTFPAALELPLMIHLYGAELPRELLGNSRYTGVNQYRFGTHYAPAGVPSAGSHTFTDLAPGTYWICWTLHDTTDGQEIDPFENCEIIEIHPGENSYQIEP